MWTLLILGLIGGAIALKYRAQLIFFASIFYSFYVWPCLGVFSPMVECHTCYTKHLMWFFGVSMKKLPESKKLYCTRDNETIVFINHRSLADIFVHDDITKTSCSFLARAMVGIAFPILFLLTQCCHCVWFFKRGGRGAKLEKFFKWCDNQKKWPFTTKKSLIIYPEGHRNVSSEPLTLKKGMIKYAWTRKLPIQVIIAFGLKDMMEEKKLRVNLENNNGIYYIEDPIFPGKFGSELEFELAVKETFENAFYFARDHPMNPKLGKSKAFQ
eukprot:TRINITY_DN1955_c0_g1_i1.p1 TRINITY_DN1955_c0_g1~~TRINITY_DN1955_c0_g1_i1.p1  ORF type:complete len:270 (+),score=14.91 TRINITY_DN1955_c0_g1_i1:11-820(+)